MSLAGWDKAMQRYGADRERRRIRRDQSVNVAWLRKYVSATIANELAAATRAKKGKRT